MELVVVFSASCNYGELLQILVLDLHYLKQAESGKAVEQMGDPVEVVLQPVMEVTQQD